MASALHLIVHIARLFDGTRRIVDVTEVSGMEGNLITLASPFFKDEYFPEALVLKAVVYYENCRYTEALTMVED